MRSVVFCSSQRFAKELDEFIVKLRGLAAKRGQHLVIFEPGFEKLERSFNKNASEKDRMKTFEYRVGVAGKVYDHLFRKVRVADVCFVFNKKGYLGVNTLGELFAAAMAGKICYALEGQTLMGTYPHDLYEEPAARKLVHEIVPSPQELLKRLL